MTDDPEYGGYVQDADGSWSVLYEDGRSIPVELAGPAAEAAVLRLTGAQRPRRLKVVRVTERDNNTEEVTPMVDVLGPGPDGSAGDNWNEDPREDRADD
ncbi:hypothetical protein [Nocardia australiensis]|uniref:hypothetical protein n=1 Tax=Nocardia australiensis TaxID=2887191 RepID=UPI001D1496CA|nr:hypothetical protein [Nocardia australiensis]